ncbi:MAG: hypothetical protein IKU43_10855 [Clostridia bacterium]|nr:hypothetical protein [Clostridia bacterium]
MDIKNPGTALSLIFAEIKSGTLPKTFLVEGKDEASRRLAARYTAAALMCESDDVPCLECAQCKKVMEGRHPDVTVVSAQEEKVSVDDIRKVRLDANISPFEAECKIIIFDGAQTLNVQSQNALLKILEEPPQRVYFILTAPSSKLMLQTVDSRCAKFSLGALSKSDVYRSVCEFSGGASESECLRMCNAVLYLDGFVPSEKSIGQLKEAMSICDEFYESGVFPFHRLPSKKEDSDSLKLVLKVLSLYALDLLKGKKGSTDKDGGLLSSAALSGAASKLPTRTAFYQYGFFCELYERLEENANVAAVIAVLRSGIYD